MQLHSMISIIVRIVRDYGWLDWTKNGEIAGTIGMNKRVEAFEVKLVPKKWTGSG